VFQKTVLTIECVFQKTVLTKIFASEREDIRSKHNVELRDTYLSQIYHFGDQIKGDDMGGACGAHVREGDIRGKKIA
jgi:hypothetical protein